MASIVGEIGCSQQLSLQLADHIMSDSPDWVFSRDEKLTEAEVMPRLVAAFPGFRPRWEEHLAYWKGASAGNYVDLAEFVHFVV